MEPNFLLRIVEQLVPHLVRGGDVLGDLFCRGWIEFDGTGTIAISDSFNVASITDNGTGDYTVTWDTDFANVNYAATYTSGPNAEGTSGIPSISAKVAGSVSVVTARHDNAVLLDKSINCVIAFGDQ